MRVQVRYFASVREQLGKHETVEIGPGSTVGDLRSQLQRKGAAHAEALSSGKAIRMALNQKLCSEQAPLEEGAEVAFFPPVTGG